MFHVKHFYFLYTFFRLFIVSRETLNKMLKRGNNISVKIYEIRNKENEKSIKKNSDI